jgi:hypothetical protein
VKLATIRVNGTTRAVHVEDDKAVDLGESDLVAFLRRRDRSTRAATRAEVFISGWRRTSGPRSGGTATRSR